MLEQLDTKTLQHIIETSPIGLFLTNKQGEVNWLNPTLVHLLETQPEAFIGQSEQSVSDELKALFSEQGIVRIESSSEPNKHFICTKQPLDSTAETHIHFVHDASSMHALFQERDELKNIIEEMKAVDPLTGMPNYRAILSALEPQVSRSRRYGNVLSTIIVQLTNLSELQSILGEAQTNDLIIACSHMLNDQVRWADMIGHIDAHEFLLILPETSEQDSHKLKDILSERFENIQVGDMTEKNLTLDVHFGVAQWSKGMDVPLFIQAARDTLENTFSQTRTA